MPTLPIDPQPAGFASRRAFFRTPARAVGGFVLGRPALAEGASPPVPRTVYKDPHCGCCAQWVAQVRPAGFAVTVRDTSDMATVKAAMGVPEALGSCHTARVGAYTIEGHVPADVIKQLLAEKPVARGVAVPGMPMGSPGMEQGGRKDRYDVLLFDKAGRTRVFASR